MNKEKKHISEEEIAEYADALINGNEQKISEKVKKHVEICPKCKSEVWDTFKILDNEKKQQLANKSHNKKV